MNDKELIEKAREAREKAYAPYSHFAVGAALLTASGTVYTGTNIENSSFGLTCCAERVAVFKAVSAGEQEFEKIAIVGSKEGEALPCGACLQVLAEFAPEVMIITFDGKETHTYALRDLLPKGFHFMGP